MRACVFYILYFISYISGASLAQDRGRLESKIESLQYEIATLKKHLEVGLFKSLNLILLNLVIQDHFSTFPGVGCSSVVKCPL